ncbi:hypothetical protein RINTHM_14350 [Richelia intracellularis HM01]|nr:hypothetical protein RINTHM_14350 [Richelia intracellularis HM01]
MRFCQNSWGLLASGNKQENPIIAIFSIILFVYFLMYLSYKLSYKRRKSGL